MAQARTDTRDGAKARRARTRELIELGGLVHKCGLPERVAAWEPDWRAVIFGALLDLVGQLGETAPADTAARTQIARWRERGRAVFRAENPSLDVER